MSERLVIGLNAVIASLQNISPRVLCVEREGGWGLPFGQFDPSLHRTFDIGLRAFVKKQAAVPLGYVEQLYTFGDMGRESPRATMKDADPTDRVISVGYLALSPTMILSARQKAAWHDWYDYFPWEDWRAGPPQSLTHKIIPALREWADTADRRARLRASFATEGVLWQEERALERYELMYEAGLVEEAVRDTGSRAHPLSDIGRPMLSDHRRILATAIGRLRGKLRYRPIVFQMMPPLFTLTQLQTAVETILGFSVHKQNFRRGIELADLVAKTDKLSEATGGRPAALYRPSDLAFEKYAPGLPLPRLKQ
ncbi:MAG: NAD regulator [Pseudomonadota bacterium]